MFWNRSLDYLIDNYPDDENLFFLFGRNAYLKTRNAEGDRAFEKVRSHGFKKSLARFAYKSRAFVRNIAKILYLKIKT